MYLTNFNVLLFLLLDIVNSSAQTDSLRAKDFQLIVEYHDRTVDTLEIHRIANYSSNNIVHHAYGIIIDDNFETGPHILYTLNGQFDFIDKHGNKLCFGFQIHSSSDSKYSLITSSFSGCAKRTEEDQLSGYYYYLKGNLEDIFQYKSSILFVIDEKKGLRVELKIKD